jgi:hypothetical protein
MIWCLWLGAGVTISTPSSSSYRFPSSGKRSRSSTVYNGIETAIPISYLLGAHKVHSALRMIACKADEHVTVSARLVPSLLVVSIEFVLPEARGWLKLRGMMRASFR